MPSTLLNLKHKQSKTSVKHLFYPRNESVKRGSLSFGAEHSSQCINAVLERGPSMGGDQREEESRNLSQKR